MNVGGNMTGDSAGNLRDRV